MCFCCILFSASESKTWQTFGLWDFSTFVLGTADCGLWTSGFVASNSIQKHICQLAALCAPASAREMGAKMPAGLEKSRKNSWKWRPTGGTIKTPLQDDSFGLDCSPGSSAFPYFPFPNNGRNKRFNQAPDNGQNLKRKTRKHLAPAGPTFTRFPFFSIFFFVLSGSHNDNVNFHSPDPKMDL